MRKQIMLTVEYRSLDNSLSFDLRPKEKQRFSIMMKAEARYQENENYINNMGNWNWCVLKEIKKQKMLQIKLWNWTDKL